MLDLILVYIFFFVLFMLLGFLIIRNDNVKSNLRLPLHIVLVSIAVWFFCNAMVQLSTTEKSVWFWHEAKFFGAFSIPLANLFFTLNFMKIRDKITKGFSRFLITLTILSIILALTNDWTHLFRTSYEVFDGGGLTYVITENAIGFYLTTVYSYLLILISTGLLIKYAFSLPKYYRAQPLLLVFAIMVPIGLNISYNFKLLGEYYDYTSMGFMVTGLLYYGSVVYFKVPDVIGIARDIIVDNLNDLILVCDNNGVVIDYNERAKSVLEAYGLLGKKLYFEEEFKRILAYGNSRIKPFYNTYVYEFTDEMGKEYYDLVEKEIIYKGHGLGKLITFRDITENYILVKKLENIAVVDSLTGLYNRNYFSEFVDDISYPIGVIYGGINSFKLLNESFGQDVGDEILKLVGQIFKDEAPQKAMVGRYDGDEFLMVVSGEQATGIHDYTRAIQTKISDINLFNTSVSMCMVSEIYGESDKPLKLLISDIQKSMDRKKLLETKSSKSAIIESLRLTLEQSDYETKQHTDRTTSLARKIGERVGLSKHEVSELAMLAALHDIGKVAIPDAILLKPGKLTNEEFDIMKTHTQKGYQIALASPDLVAIADGILHHHEKYDGSGYPDGLKGENISIQSRIITLVDSYDVMVNERPYKSAMTMDEAIEEVKRCSGSHFDPYLAEILIDIVTSE